MLNRRIIPFMALIVAIVATSCKPTTVTTYPESIVGYWEASSGDINKWYGLDITDAHTATFITYYSQKDPEIQEKNLTYDATTGKGHISNSEGVIRLRATTDSTLALTLEQGTVIFYRGIRPKPFINLTGLWKSNRIDDMGLDIIVYPKDAKETINVTVIEADDAAKFHVGAMGTLTSFNQETGDAFITSGLYTGKIHIITGIDPLSMTLAESDKMYVLTKQAKVTDAPASLEGTWSVSIPAVASITVTVAKDNNCTMDYAMVDPVTMTPLTGTIEGTIYYCPAATMGAIHLHNIDKQPQLAELLGEHACKIFQVDSENEITAIIRGMEVTFKKK